ncbi:MAG: tRNA (adenosine(37)-N6)-dimethylallyltransferase MiaA [Deltaproteobacteria bacterium]|nr:tRNA (adenosine(37)-N6)-dimethylallyltransferase MiaA [Deltaproteobacteria bacterium]
MTPKIIVILGPTASGKSRLAVELALSVGGEVVNADSQQVYRGMNIGTSKPSAAEMRGVPHHLYSLVEPDTGFDAAEFARRADEAIGDIVTRRRVPIVCGGTGLYVRSLTRGLAEMPPVPPAIREKVGAEIEKKGVAAAHGRLHGVDPGAAEKISPTDRQRIRRALEVFEATGVPISEFQKKHRFSARRYECAKFALRVPRAELHRRIGERSRLMFEHGLVEEVRGLLSKGHAPTLRAFKAIGYRQAVDVIRGLLTVEQAVELTARDTRRYAKRQETWFRADPEVRWVDAGDADAALKLVRAFLGL